MAKSSRKLPDSFLLHATLDGLQKLMLKVESIQMQYISIPDWTSTESAPVSWQLAQQDSVLLSKVNILGVARVFVLSFAISIQKLSVVLYKILHSFLCLTQR